MKNKREIIVKTQQELDSIPLDFKGRIIIDCGANDWLQIRHNYHLPIIVKGNSSVVVCAFPGDDFWIVEAYGTSSIKVNGYSLVKTFEKSTIEAYKNSSVEAYDYSTVWAFDKSSIKLYENSGAGVYDYSFVEAFDNSNIRAFGNSSVRAFDYSTVKAFDYSTVEAYENSSVEADEYSIVRAYGNSSIRAYGNVQVVKFEGEIKIFDNARIVSGV